MNRIEIGYCPKCRWLLRAAWIAQELLTTFEEELQEVTLSKQGSGVFYVRLNGDIIADRKRDGGFVELPELKQRVRDRIAPARDLGHIDRRG
jgi:selenoprotein W-related protein